MLLFKEENHSHISVLSNGTEVTVEKNTSNVNWQISFSLFLFPGKLSPLSFKYIIFKQTYLCGDLGGGGCINSGISHGGL